MMSMFHFCSEYHGISDSVTTPMSRKPCSKWAPNLNNDVCEDISSKLSVGSSYVIFVGRASIRKNKIPGKSGWPGIYYTWEGIETMLPKSKYLIFSPQCSFSRIPHNNISGAPLPNGAIIGGNLNEVPLYVARGSILHTYTYISIQYGTFLDIMTMSTDRDISRTFAWILYTMRWSYLCFGYGLEQWFTSQISKSKDYIYGIWVYKVLGI